MSGVRFGVRQGPDVTNESVSSNQFRRDVESVGRLCAVNQRRLLHAIARLDRSGEWLLDGAATCSHWVAAALEIEVCTAREWLRIGLLLGELRVTTRHSSRAASRTAKSEH